MFGGAWMPPVAGAEDGQDAGSGGGREEEAKETRDVA